MKLVFAVLVAVLTLSNASVIRRFRRNANNECKLYNNNLLLIKLVNEQPQFILDKMCVPEELLDSCKEMASQVTKSSAKIICIPARDR